jgi:aspartyl protease family protein
MPKLFTVKWPWLARAEATLLFPVMVITAGALTARTWFFPYQGMFECVLAWTVLTEIAALTFLGLLIAADRLLKVRGGSAILSGLATIVWSGAAAVLSDDLGSLSPFDPAPGAFPAVVASIVAALSLLAHYRAFGILGSKPRRNAQPNPNPHWRSRLARYQYDEVVVPAMVIVQPRPPSDLLEFIKRLTWNSSDTVMIATITGLLLGVGLITGWITINYHHDSPPAAAARLEPVHSAFAGINDAEPARTGVSREAAAMSDAPPAAPARTDRAIAMRDGEASATRGEDGRFVFDVAINGVSMPMTYDADALLVTLRAEDAMRLGVSYGRLDFSSKIKTAKGFTDVAGITIQTMTIGSITYHLVPGFVARQGRLDGSLLGHSFLGRLTAYRVENDRLTLVGGQVASADGGSNAR